MIFFVKSSNALLRVRNPYSLQDLDTQNRSSHPLFVMIGVPSPARKRGFGISENLPPYFFQPVAPVNAGPHAGHRKQESQAHVAPELARRPFPAARRGRSLWAISAGRSKEVRGREEPVPRQGRHQERGKRPFHGNQNRQKRHAAKTAYCHLGASLNSGKSKSRKNAGTISRIGKGSGTMCVMS